MLRRAVEWPLKHRDTFVRLGLRPPRGILLYGPPGCSKTTMVKALARTAGATFLALNSATIYSAYVGEAEHTGTCDATTLAAAAAHSVLTVARPHAATDAGAWPRSVREMFGRGRAGLPAVLFFDEIDALVAKRSTDGGAGTRDAVQERVLSTLLNEMDGIESAEGLLVVVRSVSVLRGA